MMTIRFPSGFSVQYNDANHLTYIGNDPNQIARISTAKENGRWICDVPLAGSGVIIEVTRPCRTYNASAVDEGQLLDECIKRLRKFDGYGLAVLKRELSKFDGKRKCWK